MKRVLVIGGGSIGERHVRCFQRTGQADVGLCEIDETVRRNVQQRYGLNSVFDSLDAACETPFDAAVICTPAHLHIPMATRLAKLDCHLLIEKPLSTSLEGIDELQQLVTQRRLVAGVAYVLRAHPGLQQLKQALDSGRFGKPVEVVATSGQHFPLYRPAYREIYYTRHETGGGAIQDALTHVLNAVQWLIGPVTRLVTDAAHCLLPGVEVEDTVHLLTRHQHILGSFTLNQHQYPNESTLTVLCERGAVRLESHHQRWLSCAQPGDDWTVEEQFELERDDLFVRQADAFLAGIEAPGERPVACSLTEARQTLACSLAALRSASSGRWEAV